MTIILKGKITLTFHDPVTRGHCTIRSYKQYNLGLNLRYSIICSSRMEQWRLNCVIFLYVVISSYASVLGGGWSGTLCVDRVASDPQRWPLEVTVLGFKVYFTLSGAAYKVNGQHEDCWEQVSWDTTVHFVIFRITRLFCSSTKVKQQEIQKAQTHSLNDTMSICYRLPCGELLQLIKVSESQWNITWKLMCSMDLYDV